MKLKKRNSSITLLIICASFGLIVAFAFTLPGARAAFPIAGEFSPDLEMEHEPVPEQTETNTPSRFADISEIEKAVRMPILMYHDVQDIEVSDDGNVMPLAQFEAHLQYLTDHDFTTISVAEFVAAYRGEINLPKKSILITFDDGFQSIKTLIAPLLEQYEMHATSFIIGSYTDRPDWHLTHADIRELQQSPWLDFESHTFDLHHNGVEKGIINEVSSAEIIADNVSIEALLQQPTQILCYPFGAFSDSAIAGLEAAGIPFGFAINPGLSSWVYLNEDKTTPTGEIQHPRSLPRVRINANISIDTFADLITDSE